MWVYKSLHLDTASSKMSVYSITGDMMKIPNNLTQAWLDKKGYKLVEVYRNGYRLAILKSVGRKWAHLTVLASGDNFKLPVEQLVYKPVIRKRGRWAVEAA